VARVDLTRRRRTGVKLLTVTVPAIAIVSLVLMLVTEVWVRATFDARHGTPGLFVPDPVRRMRLAANYSGWFAGVPVHTNSLGLRDDREYALPKTPATFRILVLGDSVTFGHGSVAEHSYPRLLEGLLRAWRPEIDWQVWNAAVPGYNTSQELAQLLELGPITRPDLVVVGFYDNDIMDNFEVVTPGRLTVAATGARALAQRHLYSLELYRKLWLTLQWKLSASNAYRRRLEALDSEDSMYRPLAEAVDRDKQALTPYERLDDRTVRGQQCHAGQVPDPALADAIQRDAGWPLWQRAVSGFERLHASGAYRIVFFLNVIPVVCPADDIFYDGGVGVENDLFMRTVSRSLPAVSVFDAFLHRRPSQMPYAQAHAIGNANLTKAETLFAYLRDRQLVPPR
jgi:hypothetical protein